MPLATRERIWEELPPLDGEPEVKIEKKEVHEQVDGVDTVKTVEVRTETVRKLKCVEERKTWALFGLSDEDIKANDGMSESEEVVWEYPTTEKKAEKKQTDKKEFDEVKCRFCGGSHFSHQCPRRNMAEPSKPAEEESAAAAPAGGDRLTQSQGPASAGGKYSVRDRLGKSSGPSRSSNFDDEYRVRVSNLSENATEDDVRDLFGRFGRITRCFVKTKYDGTNCGFAFVNYEREKDALQAIERLNGYAYDHLILVVEMQKRKDGK